jgi:phytoene dehydrogenase-like protein
MSDKFDAVIIGAGHNGLVTAAYLARAGLKVLVLERRAVIGGAAATEEVVEGYHFNTGAHNAGLFRPEIVADLELESYGLTLLESPVVAFAPQPDGNALTIWQEVEKTVEEISHWSPNDARHYPAFVHNVRNFAKVLDGMMTITPPNIAKEVRTGEVFPWLSTALQARRLGRREMMAFLRFLPQTVTDFLGEWFESEPLQGLLGSSGVTGTRQGPWASGTAFVFLYHQLGAPVNGFRASRFVRGGIGQLANTLVEVINGRGGEIRVGAEVADIVVKDYRAVGVRMHDGEEISARVVVSNADPRRTLLGLVGASHLELRVVRRAKNIRLKGCTAKVNLGLSGLPVFAGQANSDSLSGHIVISPSLTYLERAYDEAKYGRFSARPYLDVVIPTLLDPTLSPPGRHIMSITMQYAPYDLRDGSWEEKREILGDAVISTLAEYAPNLPELILHRQVLTPLDWEQSYGMTEGGIYHGQMALDQMLFMRPIPGYGQYRLPVEDLYLCGAGAHPGGGVTGAPGYNAAREILRALGA